MKREREKKPYRALEIKAGCMERVISGRTSDEECVPNVPKLNMVCIREDMETLVRDINTVQLLVD